MTTVSSQSNTLEFSPFAPNGTSRNLETTLKQVSDEEMAEVESNPSMFMFRIIDQKDGDKRLVWDSTRMADIREARRMFDKFKSMGLQGYRVNASGAKTTEALDAFDPTAEEIIFVPMTLVGGG